MAHTAVASHVDERLETLLEIERRLERRVRDAEQSARERIDRARADAVRQSDDERAAALEASRREEELDRQRLATELARIEAEADAAVARAAALEDADVERLAGEVYARIVGGGS